MNLCRSTAALLLGGMLLFLQTGCSDNSSPYPDNVYLTEFVEWSPGLVGSARMDSDYTDTEGHPLQEFTDYALGPPEGSGSYTGGDGTTCPVGINGWAVWQFDPDYVIINGTGDDFVTFTKTWAWGRDADGLCCELARVEVSEDGSVWYELSDSALSYDENPDPSQSNGNYVYSNVSGLHGNSPTWANYNKDIQAEVLVADTDGTESWEDLEGVMVSRYFNADDDYLGGIRFNLDDFHLKDDSTETWPSDGEMRFLKIIDDDTILDGQDYLKSYSLGANLMAAMGINTASAE